MLGVLIIVENLTVPMDRRVWQEATALRQAGYTVSVICPKGGKYQEAYEEREGVHIFRHGLPLEGNGIVGFIGEYVCAFAAELWLAFKVRRRIGFDVIQACNPPDNIFIIGTLFRRLFGTKFVFDHHDPFAALFDLKFPRSRFLRWVAHYAEKRSLTTADQVITTSNELRKLAISAYGVAEDRIHLVRSGFNFARIPAVSADPALRKGRKFLVLYIGVMGKQDGIDLLLQAVSHLVHEQKRTDMHFALAGGGAECAAMQALSREMGLEEYVEFTGYLEGEPLYKLLATADIGVCPDPKNDFNDKLSMNKVLEYMAFNIPVVQFDLNEGRYIAQEAAVYAQRNDPRDFAQAIASLADQPEERARRGAIGKARLHEHFDWKSQETVYVDMYRKLIGQA